MNKDELYMQRAIDLAKNGMGNVSPNPMVGAVIVYKDTIIGEGWHERFGGAHAEVNAINSVENLQFLPESTIYVTLEPCSHFGKTPPCADLLIQHTFSRVVIGHEDISAHVGGKGIQKLKEAGIKVEIGVLKADCYQLNCRFFTFYEKKRPYVILKWAQTSDNFVARKDYTSKWISTPSSRLLVHKWRAEEQAIAVGTNTAHYDNPELTVRKWIGNNPCRIVLDRNNRLSKNLKVFTGGPTICYTENRHDKKGNTEWVSLGENFSIHAILDDLVSRNVMSLFVEGGSRLIQSFIENDLWDEARVFISTQKFEDGIPAPAVNGTYLQEEINLEDKLLLYQNNK